MKKPFRILLALLFAGVYSVTCISSSYDGFNGYLGHHTLEYTVIRYIVIFILLFIITALNKDNIIFLSYYIPVYMVMLSFAATYDYYVYRHYVHNFAYFFWFCAAVFVANASVFISGTVFFKEDYFKFFRNFWLGFIPFYLLLFKIAFIRQHNTGVTVNLKLFHGTMKYTHFLLTTPSRDSYILLIFIGNIAIFLPVAFILKSIFKNIPNLALIITGVALPFLVEGYQYLFKCGDVDIDDIVLNISGFLVGFIILKIAEKRKAALSEN